jgi:mannobiose 2-epimerase
MVAEDASVAGAGDLRRAVESHLRGNLLPFWRSRSVDERDGGFIGEMGQDGALRPEADKALILNARLLWTFAALFRALGDPADLELARRAFATLTERFADPEHGGYVWSIGPDGAIRDASKKTYGQAFCVYALCEYHLATGDPEALQEALRVFERIEAHARDAEHGGYIETRARDWSPAGDLRLSQRDLDAPKSMNAHLHVVEGYANLYRAAPRPEVGARLSEVIGLFDRHILGPERRHLRPFFGPGWEVRSSDYTYGHDIEAIWLLLESAQVLADPGLLAATRSFVPQVAGAVLEEAIDPQGGVAYEGRGGGVIDPNREWWCQGEAVVGFLCAHQVTGRGEFLDAALRVWGFIERFVIDHQGGEWFYRVFPDGTVDPKEPKVGQWKCPYHTVRTCLEVMRRIPAS